LHVKNKSFILLYFVLSFLVLINVFVLDLQKITSYNYYYVKNTERSGGMKLLTFYYQGKEQIGVLSSSEKTIYPISGFGLKYTTMNELIVNLTAGERKALEDGVEDGIVDGVLLSSVKTLAPVPYPNQDIICLGLNYRDHAEESARYKEEDFGGERPHAVYFSKRVNYAIGDGELIDSHSGYAERLDYEVELAFIIGKDAKNVAAKDVKDYIFGYTIMNDVSAREIQNRHKQWYLGKSLDDFTPMGPWIVTADEISYPPKLDLRSSVNGELRQNSNTRFLIFDIDHIVSELSQGMTLKAGTIIATGTPGGVGMGFDPPKFLKQGDIVECAIEGIGKITNRVK